MLLNSIGLVCRGKCRVADARIVELEEQLAASQGAEATAKAARQIQIERLKKAMKGILLGFSAIAFFVSRLSWFRDSKFTKYCDSSLQRLSLCLLKHPLAAI